MTQPTGLAAEMRSGRIARRLVPGTVLVASAWSANWLLTGPRTHLLFLPLWLGYILIVDGAALWLRGDSILHRSPRGWVRLFALSALVWWLFELFNLRTQNWEYVGREHFDDVEYFLLCTLSFTTVMPAVLGTAELVRGAPWIERFARGPAIPATRTLLAGSFALGLFLALLLFLWPSVFFPFLWVAPVLCLEPLVHFRGRRSLLTDLERGDWRPWMSLWIGVLVCGFFWELWNVRSYPKWVYHIPGVDFLRLFEMPLLGYLGYLPFSQALFLLKELILSRDPELHL